ncbi:MAG TPA: ACT domain-containing protein, partial [Gammaproteobacteria bacterium]|nr:ACT domain-containing protein [Gammaproteobacteria bacterium]
PNEPGIAHRIIGPISDANVEVDMIVQNVARDGRLDFSFTIHRNDYPQVMDILQAKLGEIGAESLKGNDRVVKLSVVGVGMRSHAGVASTLFRALAEKQIDIRMIATSEIKVSVVVDEKHLEQGVRVLHQAFGLQNEPREDALHRRTSG